MRRQKSSYSPSNDQSLTIDPDIIHSYIAGLNPHSKDEISADSFRWHYLLDSLLSKLPREGISADTRASRAIDKMLESEVACKEINDHGYGRNTPNMFFNSVLTEAKSLIEGILGDFCYSIFDKSSFSGGASTSRSRRNGDPYYKYDTRRPVNVTPACYPYGLALIEQTPIWCAQMGKESITLAMGNHITTVPKKTEIDRAIAKEPDLNMCLQRAVGTFMRSRLKQFGIDLKDQTRNQRLALRGSLDGSLATIDLAAASDSLCYRLVWDLLPEKWFRVLDDLRSPFGELPNGKVVRWEKFSSMGNGFTFELETLIFYALARAVQNVSYGKFGFYHASNSSPCAFGSPIGVYGDDLIISSTLARNIISVLSDVGFQTNTDKTFISGKFRESCGKHYYEGIDVTPFYIRKKIDNLPRICWLLNNIRKWSYSEELQICDPLLYDLWVSLRRTFVPSRLLGGSDVDSSSYVASPHAKRDRILYSTDNIKINGTRALLRCFQYQLGDTSPYVHKYVNVDVDIQPSFSSESFSKELVRVNPAKIKFKRNLEPSWVPLSMLFPKEIAT